VPDDFEPFDEGPTEVDDRTPIPEPVITAKHDTLEHATGREAGFTEGVELALAALRIELAGWTQDEVAALFFRLREACRRAG
jgi:hypothetical protein